MTSRKQIRDHDKKCEKLSAAVDKALVKSDYWAFDKFNDCKSTKCRNTADKNSQKWLDKSQKLQQKQSNCERTRPD